MLISTFKTQQLSLDLRPQVFNHASNSCQKKPLTKQTAERQLRTKSTLLIVQIHVILWDEDHWTSDNVEKLIGFKMILFAHETLPVGEARGSKSFLALVDFQQPYRMHPILPL